MKSDIKEKVLRWIYDFARHFALYGIMPVMFIGFICLVLAINSFGAEDLKRITDEFGEKSISTIIGDVRGKESISFYFPSSDISFPLNADVIKGKKTYFKSAPDEKEPENMVFYESLPSGASPVVKCDFSSPNFYLNQTKFTIDIDEIKNRKYPVSVEKISASEPLVLVLHTHGTESYLDDNNNLSSFAPEGVSTYYIDGDMAHRTSDITKNVVRVGSVFSEKLNSLGIPTLHCETMHDEQSYNAAYSNSAATVREYLLKYPSIKYVIDLHRDSIQRENTLVKPYTEIAGKPTAQIMLVVGSNQNSNHPNWEENLKVASVYKETLDSSYPTLSRPMYIRTGRYNQEILPGSMLLEVGSAANSLAEAENAARLAASALAEMIKSN